MQSIFFSVIAGGIISFLKRNFDDSTATARTRNKSLFANNRIGEGPCYAVVAVKGIAKDLKEIAREIKLNGKLRL